MPRENCAVKARRLLVEGRVLLDHVDTDGFIDATIRGDSGAVYRVAHRRGAWSCDCEAVGRCSHLAALMLITAPVRPIGTKPPKAVR